MEQETYNQYEKELASLLGERPCIVYNSLTDQYLKELRPIAINFDNYSDNQLSNAILAMNFVDAEICGPPEWTNVFNEAYRITSIPGVYFIMNNLLWMREDFPNCRFFLINDNDTLDFDDLFIWSRDHEFIQFLIDEYGEI